MSLFHQSHNLGSNPAPATIIQIKPAFAGFIAIYPPLLSLSGLRPFYSTVRFYHLPQAKFCSPNQ